MKKISIYALVISILWSATSSSAQTVIQGFIYDKKKHTPIGSASIRINTLNISTISDKYGYFILSLDPKHSITDKLSLQVSHISYKNITYVWEKLDDTLFIYLDSKIHQLPEVIVQSLYINDDSPFPYTQYSNQEIKQKNIVSDIPFIIGDSPSVTKTSDSGTGIGYTSLRIRGIDAGRINITLNDVPLNDAESQIVYWVNLPDLASSLETIQIQRGISTSGNGGSSFGGSLHLNTVLPPDNPKAEIALTYGSFDTRKFRLNISTGNIGQWAFNGKFSIIKSDGYIDRSFSDLSSYHFTISYKNTRHILKMEVISGKEQTYQAWNGVPEPIIKNNSEQLENYISSLYINEEHAQHHRNNIGSRTFNPFVYENQTDNYRQDHYLSQYQHTLNKNLLLQGTLHYTYGRGFYEEYQTEQDLYTYNLHPVSNENYSSLIRQLWLRNHYYGSVTTLSWIEQKHNIKSGIGLHFYHGDHYGNVIETPQLKKLDHQYYFNDAFKQNMYGYIKSIWKPSKKWNLYSDFKYRYIYYNFSGKDIQHTTEDAQQITDVQQKTNYHFFTPKFGITFYPIPNIRTYTSFSWGYKEPTRNELISSTHNSRPQPEKLFDIEIGFDWNNENISTSVNGYYMDYKNQLITTGEINDVGLYIRQNIPKSKRTGIEMTATIQFLKQFTWQSNATLSSNIIEDYNYYLDNYDKNTQESRDLGDTQISFSPNLIMNHVLSYAHGNLFSIALNAQYISRQYLDNTQNHNRSISSYFIQNLELQYNLLNHRAYSIKFNLHINNLGNLRYQNNGYTFGFIADGQEQHFNYYYPQAPRHIFLQMAIGF